MTLVIAFSPQNTFDVVKLIRRICSNTSSNTSGDQLAKGSVTTTLDTRQRERQLTSVRSERGMLDVYSQALYTSPESDQHHARRLQLFSRVRGLESWWYCENSLDKVLLDYTDDIHILCHGGLWERVCTCSTLNSDKR
jgi:hypothetical protein